MPGGGVWRKLGGWLGLSTPAAEPVDRDLALFPERNPEPVLLLARSGALIYANPPAWTLLPRHGSLRRDLLPPDVAERIHRLWSSGAGEGRFEFAADGRLLICRAFLLPDRQVAHVYVSDVTEARSAEAQLLHSRGHDALTGLANRVAFTSRVEQALLDRPGGRVVVLLLNLDRMRRVNESLGHAAGDDVLREAARRLRSAAQGLAERPGEAFRLHGDSLAVLLTSAAPDASPARLARIVQDALRAPFETTGRQVFVTASLGIAVAPADGNDAATLLRAAEAALDRVKREGGDGFRCFAPGLDAMARDFLDLAAALHGALSRRELSLVYQPQVELTASRVVGQEALLRWERPERGATPPDQFVPVAEETGLIAPIGAWALREACSAARGWRTGSATRPQHVAVNVAARQLHDPHFCESVASALADTGLSGERLEVEITESTAMADPEAVRRTLACLGGLGVGVAIDDFGTGYSSLAYLSRFPVGRIKIDRAFTQGIGRQREAEGIVRAVIEMGHRLGARVLAEGVETVAQADALRSWGCDEAQGFLFGRPGRLAADGSTLPEKFQPV